ncbi:hypothetical protein ACFYZ8_34345 [Streptomyces sp. NPDC001668]|uniref:hypothetical protein n=1 Tax=Streptomyces sp. NPDC001668 TaxID=3364598 RepID=UPI0036CA57B2
MTATSINGIDVVEDQPAQSPLTRPGVHVVFDKIRHLLLADGSEWYGCALCDYTSQNKNSILPHLKAHAPKKAPSSKAGKAITAVRPNRAPSSAPSSRRTPSRRADGGLASLTLGELVTRAQQTDQLREQRDAARAELKEALRQGNGWKSQVTELRAQVEHWKQRASVAERQLARVGRLVGASA